MHFPKLYTFLLILLFYSIHLSGKTDSVKINNSNIDSIETKIFNPFYETNLNKPYLFYDGEENKWKVFVPKYSLKSSSIFQTENLLLYNFSRKFQWTSTEDELESFKISLNILREIEYKNRMKYDLGEVGKYLGLSKNIMALILALLSVLKH